MATPDHLEAPGALASTFEQVHRLATDGWTLFEPLIREVSFLRGPRASEDGKADVPCADTGHREEYRKEEVHCFEVFYTYSEEEGQSDEGFGR